jgi:hypothetical protein
MQDLNGGTSVQHNKPSPSKSSSLIKMLAQPQEDSSINKVLNLKFICRGGGGGGGTFVFLVSYVYSITVLCHLQKMC